MMRHFSLIFAVVIFKTHFKDISGLSCPREPYGPCDQPICCNLHTKQYSRNDRDLDIHPMLHSIQLVHDNCGGHSIGCPNLCPKQLGETCGGTWNGEGDCDAQWLKCEGSGPDFGTNAIGRCVRTYGRYGRKARNLKKSEEPQRDTVPVCEDMKITCQCENSTQNFHKDLPLDSQWCFLEKIESANDPKKNCYDDVKWSKTIGRFWSYEAYRAKTSSRKYHLYYISKILQRNIYILSYENKGKSVRYFYLILGDSSQSYEKMEAKRCTTFKMKSIKDINQAKEACSKMLECTGIMNGKCRGNHYKLCRSSNFRRTKNGHCVLRKVLGKTVKISTRQSRVSP